MPFLWIRHLICQFVCIPNSTTSEPDYYGHPAKPKEIQYDIGAGKEIILLISEHNVSHSSCLAIRQVAKNLLARLSGKFVIFKCLIDFQFSTQQQFLLL